MDSISQSVASIVCISIMAVLCSVVYLADKKYIQQAKNQQSVASLRVEDLVFFKQRKLNRISSILFTE